VFLLLALSVATAVASFGLTAFARRYALRRAILDIPTDRSSHNVPMPRGGGLAIMVSALCSISLLAVIGRVPTELAVGLVGGAALISAVGWIDDRRGLTPRTRLLAHLVAALWFLGWTGGFSDLTVGSRQIPFGPLGLPLAALTIIWFVNLYNFMDGIDGLAAGEAVAVGGFAGILLLTMGYLDLAAIAFCVAAASAGFLAWNWAPAKIFMGDSGSGMLGFLFIALAFTSEKSAAIPLIAWLAMLGVFFFDATTTLIRRVIKRERWREAHRSHAYQRAARRLGSHAAASAASLLVTLLLCGLAAWLTLAPDKFLFALVAIAVLLAGVYLGVETVAPMHSPEESDIPPRGPMVA
jgi:Fuc2NAc and GlcNAc transferase